MKISGLINKLQEVQKKHGDIESCYQAGDAWYNTDGMEFDVYNQILYFRQLWNTRQTNEQRT